VERIETYHRMPLTFRDGDRTMLEIYVVEGLSVSKAIELLIEHYRPPDTQQRDRDRVDEAERASRAIDYLLNRREAFRTRPDADAPPIPKQLICAGCAARLEKFNQFAHQPSQSYGNCELCHEAKYLRAIPK